jgi:GT2 family glycosyltransferase
MQNPLISVVILNYRRWDALKYTVASVLSQSYAHREIIVVDNGSGDDTADLIRQHFPGVTLLQLDTNAGCAGRNRGIEVAHGECVVTLDNDVFFDSDFELQKIANEFANCPHASCLAFKVLEANTGRLHVRDWCHPRYFKQYSDSDFETIYIPEGACAFRRRDFLALGGYYEPFWIGHEGGDLALRMLNHGQRIFYCPSIRVRHLMSAATRTSWRPYYYYTRNYLWLAVRNLPLFRAIPYLTVKLSMMLLFALRTSNFKAMFRGIRDALLGFKTVWGTRQPLSRVAFRKLADLSSDHPGFFARLRRHRERPLV